MSNWLQSTPDGTLTTVIATTRKWANEHKDTVQKIRDAMKEAEAFEKGRDPDTFASIGKHTGVDPKLVATIPVPNLVVDITPQQAQWWIDIAKEQGLIKKDMKPSDVLFP